MRRVLILIVIAAVVVAGAVALVQSGGSSKPLSYRVELDNASGLTKGADLRAAGVKVGRISALDVEARTAKAIATVEVNRPEFGGFRADTRCETKPQSLIGEYFLDCDPGVSARKLPSGGTVPLSRTSGTVAPDLVLDIMRKPYRERFGILIAELGQGFAANGGNVNETIRRAIPALRETDKVLVLLSRERATLRQLTRDSATTFGRLNGNRNDVARFVSEAKNAAVISANRRREIAGTIRRLPTFERELTPTLRDLGTAAKLQTPALKNLQAAAPSLTTLLNRLGPFSDASLPAIQALGRASTTGIKAVSDSRKFVASLRAVAAATKEPITNLRFILEHIDDRKNAVEKNVNSPFGLGFTGLEAFLQFFFEQSQAINLFDDRGYLLRINLLINECSQYTNGSTALANPARAKRCSAALGPGGKIDPTPGTAAARSKHAKRTKRAKHASSSAKPSGSSTSSGDATPPPASPDSGAVPAPGSSSPAPSSPLPSVPAPSVPTPSTSSTPAPAPSNPASDLLGYLLG